MEHTPEEIAVLEEIYSRWLIANAVPGNGEGLNSVLSEWYAVIKKSPVEYHRRNLNVECEQHNAATRDSLHQIAQALAHLWLTNCYAEHQRLPSPSRYWVYAHHLEWGMDLLDNAGKCIKITIEIEDWKR